MCMRDAEADRLRGSDGQPDLESSVRWWRVVSDRVERSASVLCGNNGCRLACRSAGSRVRDECQATENVIYRDGHGCLLSSVRDTYRLIEAIDREEPSITILL